MDIEQIIFTLWGNEKSVAQIRVHYNMTKLAENLTLYATKFVLLHNFEPICYWNVRFLLTKMTIPENFFEEFSNTILLTRRLLSTYGVKDENQFYNNLDFNGAEVEENNAKEFASQCDKNGIVMLNEQCLKIPNCSDTIDESGEVPKITPNLSVFKFSKPMHPHGNTKVVGLIGRIPNGSILTNEDHAQTNQKSVSVKTPSPPPRPFTPEGECEHEDFHDHPVPLNQMAQKIPSLLDLEPPESSLGILYL